MGQKDEKKSPLKNIDQILSQQSRNCPEIASIISQHMYQSNANTNNQFLSFKDVKKDFCVDCMSKATYQVYLFTNVEIFFLVRQRFLLF